MKKEERSEHVFMSVTPQVKKEFDLAADNKKLQDQIIRNHISSETDWLKTEMIEIDEATVKYRAKLITIKDSFEEAQNSYIEKIEDIYTVASNTFRKLDGVANNLSRKINDSYEKIDALNKKIFNIDSSRLERLIETIERMNNMSDEQKELIRLILNK